LLSSHEIAFSDDDSWWAPGSLAQAIDLFDTHPRLGLIMSKILIEPEGRYDPCCRSMEDSPIPNRLALPGVPILGFIACGAIVRRSAFLSAGGFNYKFGTRGEEALLAVDMIKNGWGLSYVNTLVSHHYPSKARDHRPMKVQEIRNNLWTCWMRRSPAKALKITSRYIKDAIRDGEVRAGIKTALQGARWALCKREPLPRWLENQLELNEANPENC
jgi:GT2 family glycosyltransferase